MHDKAVKGEHKTAQALGEARHKHELAVAGENKAMNDLSVRYNLLELHLIAANNVSGVVPLIHFLDAPEAPSGGP